MRRLLASFVLLIALNHATPVLAGETAARFDIFIFGLKLGELGISAAETSSSYRAHVAMATTGLVAALARVRIDLSAAGRRAGDKLRPTQYDENMDTGREERINHIPFPSGSSRLDPATAILVGLRDRPLAQGCEQDFEVFDGTRRQRLTVRQVARKGDEVTCTGQLVRLAGYSAEDMAEAHGFGLRATFRIDGEMLRAISLRAATVHGTITLKRR